MVASKCVSPATKHISTSNIFKSLPDDCENIIQINHILPTEVINVDTYLDKSIKSKIIKTNYTSISISNENRKRAPKHKRKGIY